MAQKSKPRYGTCGVCKVTFLAKSRGKLPATCIDCDPNKGNRNSRKRAERLASDAPPPTNVVAPGVGGPNEARAREALQGILVAAHLRAAAGDYARAAQLAGLEPAGLDLEAIREEVETHHQDLVEGRVEGLLRVSSMFAAAVLARLTCAVNDMPIGQLGSSLKAALEAAERLQEQFGAVHSGITLQLVERDQDAM